MEKYELIKLLADAAELGATRALEKAGHIGGTVTRAHAWRLYGRKQVDRWIDEGFITLVKDGPGTRQMRIDRNQLEAVAKASNRFKYLQDVKTNTPPQTAAKQNRKAG
jgi:hypothetical protein